MPGKPAARILDAVAHPLPPALAPGPGSFNVIAGGMPVWRAVSPAAVPALQSAQATANTAIQFAENAAVLASLTPAGPAARLAAEAAKTLAASVMGSAITSAAAGADIHVCATLWPTPPHGPGVDIQGSPTVMVNGFRIGRQGDQILEAIGGMNSIMGGCTNVLVGAAGIVGNVPAGQAACVAARAGRNPAPGAVDNNGNQIQPNTAGQSYNNCGVESSRQIINTSTGANVGQEQLLTTSQASGDADTDPSGIFASGGTSPQGRANILTNNGVPAHTSPGDTGNLESNVAAGRGTIASVWAGNMPNWAGQGLAPNTGGHAILVTGIEYDDNGNPINVIINDTGMGQCSQKIPFAAFQGAMRPGRDLTVTDNPIW